MKKLYDYLEITLGAVLMAIGIQLFYLPHNLVTGGVTGLAIIILNLSESHLGFPIPLWVTNISLNLPMMLITFKLMGRDILIKSVYTIIALTVALSLAQHLPDIYHDMTVATVFGGAILGVGTALILRKGATSGGTTLMAAIVRLFMKHVKITNIIFALDFIIIVSGMIIFSPINSMYAIISIFISIKVTDIVISGFQSAKAAFILSSKSEEVGKALLTSISRGITSIPAKGVYTGQSRDMLLCIMGQKELVRAKEIIKKVDPEAFIIITSAQEVLGRGFKPLDSDNVFS